MHCHSITNISEFKTIPKFLMTECQLQIQGSKMLGQNIK